MTAARQQMVQLIHDGLDPFAGFNPKGWHDAADEWDSHHPYFDETVRDLRPRVIVEVGSFLGASSRHFALALKTFEIDGAVVCVDTWLQEEVLWNSPQWRPHLRHRYGRPTTYEAWLANALAAGLADYLCPLPMASVSAARYLHSRGVTADMVYIDGSHIEGDVIRDLTLYWDLVLRSGGVMLIDDYQNTPDFIGVVRDTDRFAAERHLGVDTRGMKARIRKPVQ